MPAPFVNADRVRDTSVTTGTGNFTLDGAPPQGYQTFNAGAGQNNYFSYCIVNGSEWEVGYGYLSAATTLVRDTLLASSTGSAINFSAGTKDVFMPFPANFASNVETNGIGYAAARGMMMQ